MDNAAWLSYPSGEETFNPAYIYYTSTLCESELPAEDWGDK